MTIQQELGAIAAQFDQLLNLIAVPTNPDLSQSSGAEVARLWVERNSQVRASLDALRYKFARVTDAISTEMQKVQSAADLPNPFIEDSEQGRAAIVRLAYLTYASMGAADGNRMPNDAIERAKNFFRELKSQRLLQG